MREMPKDETKIRQDNYQKSKRNWEQNLDNFDSLSVTELEINISGLGENLLEKFRYLQASELILPTAFDTAWP
jgi:hypothetical protein